MKILFLCVANSARSQMAEGLAKHLLGNNVEIRSAGSQPRERVQPYAIEVLKEIGIDISKNHPKSIQDLPSTFLDKLDYVITLCAEEICPVIPSKAQRLHWPILDPVSYGKDEQEKLAAFRTTREIIRDRLLLRFGVK